MRPSNKRQKIYATEFDLEEARIKYDFGVRRYEINEAEAKTYPLAPCFISGRKLRNKIGYAVGAPKQIKQGD